MSRVLQRVPVRGSSQLPCLEANATLNPGFMRENPVDVTFRRTVLTTHHNLIITRFMCIQRTDTGSPEVQRRAIKLSDSICVHVHKLPAD